MRSAAGFAGRSCGCSASGFAGRSRGCPAAKAPRTGGEVRERVREGRAGEVGPHLLAEHELRVGRLPEEIIGQTLLTACADDHVWIVQVGRVEAAAEVLLGAPLKASRSIEDL